MAVVPSDLAALVAAARAAYPELDVGDDDFRAYLAAREITKLDGLSPDLFLACAIDRAQPAALRRFEQLLQEVTGSVARLGGGSGLVEDVLSAVRERVLAPGGKGRLADYRGRGELRGWLRVVAVREALQLMRKRKREAPASDDIAAKIDDGIAVIAMTDDERRVYRDAFTAALATLTPRDRNLLRHHYLYSATVDEIGALYGVHRATAARWIAQVRETLLQRTRRHVGEALALSREDLDSAMGRIASHLEISLRHTLSHER